MGQSWWKFEDDMWGRVGVIVKKMCGAELLEFLKRCVRLSWWNCEDDVWGRVGGILKTMCGAELVEL